MQRICPLCKQPPDDEKLLLCARCKVPFVDEHSAKSNFTQSELKAISVGILKSSRFWIPLGTGLVALTWGFVQVVDYFAGVKVQDVVSRVQDGVERRLKLADEKVTKEIEQKFDQPSIQNLMEAVVAEKSGERIDKTADRIIEEKIRLELSPRIERLDKNVSESQLALARLESLSNFYEIATRVRSDDRTAFEELIRILGQPTHPSFKQAEAVLMNLPKEVEVMNLLTYPVDWVSNKIDLSTSNIDAFRELLSKVPPVFQSSVIETVWTTERFSKRDRIQLLIDVIKDTKSLRCLDKACRLLADESKVQKNFLAWQEYPKWWELNKQKY